MCAYLCAKDDAPLSPVNTFTPFGGMVIGVHDPCARAGYKIVKLHLYTINNKIYCKMNFQSPRGRIKSARRLQVRPAACHKGVSCTCELTACETCVTRCMMTSRSSSHSTLPKACRKRSGCQRRDAAR